MTRRPRLTNKYTAVVFRHRISRRHAEGTLGGLASAAPVKEAIQAADVVLLTVTTGPRFSMTAPASVGIGVPEADLSRGVRHVRV